MDKISIIIPVYNVEKEVKNCLESVINQTYENLEIIVVNDGSTDNSKEICLEIAERDNRIIYLEKQNGGLSDARNFGINNASGDYLFFLDSDDYIEHDCIESLYRAIKEDNTKIAVALPRVIYSSGAVVEKATGEHQVFSTEESLRLLMYDEKISVSAWAKLYSKDIISDIRFPVSRLFEDNATTYKFIASTDKVTFISKSVYNYIIRKGSITRSKFSLKRLDVIKSTDEMCDYCEMNFPNIKNAIIRRRVWARINVLTHLPLKGFKEIRKEMIRYVKINAKTLLRDKEVPNRDKLAIFCLSLGFYFFKFSWKFYLKLCKKN